MLAERAKPAHFALRQLAFFWRGKLKARQLRPHCGGPGPGCSAWGSSREPANASPDGRTEAPALPFRGIRHTFSKSQVHVLVLALLSGRNYQLGDQERPKNAMHFAPFDEICVEHIAL